MTGVQKMNWRVVVGAQSFTPENPGNLKGAIVLDYNSVGACVGGSLTFEGYVPWAPFSEVISVFVDGVPIGYGVVGLVSTTRSETGKRTSTVPILGRHVVDAEGLAAVGLGGSYELLGIESPLAPIPTEVKETDALGFPVTKTILVDPPFGETVNAAFQRVFKDNPLASWGVRTNGQRVAGIPAGGTAISSSAVNVRAQPSNYELTSYVSEFAERPAERWKPRVQSRNVGWLMPRRGATVQSEDMLGDQKTEAPLNFVTRNFDDAPAPSGSLVATLDLHALMVDAINNPKAKDATYELQGVSLTVQVTFDHPPLPNIPPEGWYGQNVQPLGTWQDSRGYVRLQSLKRRLDQGSDPQNQDELGEYIQSSEFPYVSTTQNGDTKLILDKNQAYWKNVANAGQTGFWPVEPEAAEVVKADYATLVDGFRSWFPAHIAEKYNDTLGQEWAFYSSQYRTVVELGEWLTTSGSDGAASAVYQAQPARNLSQPQPPSRGTGESLGDFALRNWRWSSDPDNRLASNALYALDPRRDPGLLRGLYRDTTKLDLGENRVLTWTFTVPKEFISQIDPNLPAGYKWAIGLVFSALKLGLTARGKITASAMYQKVMSGATNIHRDLPAYEQAALATPTLQGVILGEVHTGPFMVDGQQMANARVVIEANGYRTEFQTGATNGGR